MNDTEELENLMSAWSLKKSSRKENDNYFKRVRGSDPRVATCRGKLQFRRSKLNQEINKQLMIRTGAENLLKATENKKLKENVALELSFINSNLQVLKEQLSELNSSVHLYQNSSASHAMPMIPLGLKETKDINFNDIFKDFILEHYSEDMTQFEDAVTGFTQLRQAVRTPSRDSTGIQLLMEYYNLLFYIDRRFFSPHRSLGIFFEWFDSLTGLPSIQKTVAFEKACVLFNMAALYTQIGAKQERSKMEGIELAVDNFLRAAGLLQFIRANFSNAPSADLSPEILELLIQLMTGQARECLYEKLLLHDHTDIKKALEIAQEAASVAEVYGQLKQLVSQAPESIKSNLPTSWLSLMLVKHEHYSGLAHCHVGTALIDFPGDQKLADDVRATLEYLHPADHDTSEQRLNLGRSHLREALQCYEEALRMHRMCRQLRQAESLRSRLRTDLDVALQHYAQTKRDEYFQDSSPDLPPIPPASQFRLSLTAPDFSRVPVEDPFHKLGPLAVFSARSYWSAPRTVQLEKRPSEVFGFSVRGDSPVIIAGVDPGSLAQTSGMRAGDFIVAVGPQDTKWGKHEEVVAMIRAAGDSLMLRLVTPMDRNYLTAKFSSSSGSSSGVSSASSATLAKRLSWSIFRRAKPAAPISVSTDILLR